MSTRRAYHFAYYQRTIQRRREIARANARRRRSRTAKENEGRWYQWLVLRVLVELGASCRS